MSEGKERIYRQGRQEAPDGQDKKLGDSKGRETRDTRALSVAVVGSRETVVAFRAAGLAVFPLDAKADAAARVEEIIAEGYQVIFFTEELLVPLEPVLERYRRAAIPCLVALPGGIAADEQGRVATGQALQRLRDVVRRAVGSDIFGSGQGLTGKG